MPSKRKKEEKQPSGVDLTAFLTPGSEEKKTVEGEKREEPGIGALLTEEVEELILERLKPEGGGLTRSQLYEWSKKKGIKPAVFYKALTSLIEKGVVVRKFDPSKEEYVFQLSGSP
ncbi:MAG: hypothetical protein ACP5II_05705 [Infirmifilum sp.]|uniref:Uncharacterized protein n=1 Tax=Infirmifilum uzonense TaxID=1550241 RepID=A0A0F7FIT6_9CREN|nr:hypothetical protein [Infirmifilum uzonense]AKG39179.1 hypothetical protein MA03_07970 [Infirmifilum uzonense]